jgi:hypothetical protein
MRENDKNPFWPVFCGFSAQAHSRGIPQRSGHHIFLGQIAKVFGFSMKSHDSPGEELFSGLCGE